MTLVGFYCDSAGVDRHSYWFEKGDIVVGLGNYVV